MGQVHITEATEQEEFSSTRKDGTEVARGESSSPSTAADTEQVFQPPTTRFQIRPEHFTRAIDEQHERYTIQEKAEEARIRQERGRQRLIEMAADQEQQRRAPLRGWRRWLARLFGTA